MSALLAVFARNREPVAGSVLDAMMPSLSIHAVHGTDVWMDGSVAIAHFHLRITPEEQDERQPLRDPSGRFVLAFDGRIDNRAELIEQLFEDKSVGARQSDASLVLQAYQRWEDGCARRLLGDFAFVLWDQTRRSLFAARDALGGRPLCYYMDGRCCIVATEVAPILKHPGVHKELNEFKVAAFLNANWDDHTQTFFRNIFYLPPGHHLTVDEDSEKLERYWQLDPEISIRYQKEEEYAEHFLSLLTQAVQVRLRSNKAVGAALSGGLDSNTIVGIAARLMREQGNHERLNTFSYVFDELVRGDERKYIRHTLERYDVEPHFIVSDDKWPLSNFPEWPIDHEQPGQDVYIWLTEAVLRGAKAAGCGLLLTGRFGDQLFGGADFWAVDALRDGKLSTLIQFAKQQPGSKARPIHVRALLPHSAKRLYRYIRPAQYPTRHPGIDPDLTTRTHYSERAAAIQQYGDYSRPGQWQRLLKLTDIGISQSDANLNQLASKYAIGIAHPYHDLRLVEFAMAIPAYILGVPGRSKRVLRSATGEILPPVIRERRDKSALYDLFNRGVCQEEATIRRIFTNPQIIRRKFVSAGWLREELSKTNGLTGNGYPLWLCICLELWLNRYWSNV